ncbi:50S ribosomal protein L22, partial [Chryseobacterium mucoviscidosis]
MGSRKLHSAFARNEAYKDVVKASLNNCPSSP